MLTCKLDEWDVLVKENIYRISPDRAIHEHMNAVLGKVQERMKEKHFQIQGEQI